MKLRSILLACALTAAPVSAGLLDTPERMPGGTDSVVALDLSAGALPRTLSMISFSAKASEMVLTEQLYGFATETGIDLNAPMSFVLAGPRESPDKALLTGSLKIDAVKLAAALRAVPGLKIEVKETPAGLLLTDPRTALLVKDGHFTLGSRAAVEAQAAGTAPAPDNKAVAADLTARAGANAGFAFLMRLPGGLPGQPPPPSAVFGQQLGGFWIRFRALFIAVREREFALELAFDSPEAAQAGLPVVNGWLDILAGQFGSAEAMAKAAAADSGPFRHLNARWVSARLTRETYLQMRANVTIKAEGSNLSFTMPRENLQSSSVVVGTAVTGILAAVAIPQFMKYRRATQALRDKHKPAGPPSPVDNLIQGVFGQ